MNKTTKLLLTLTTLGLGLIIVKATKIITNKKKKVVDKQSITDKRAMFI